MLRNPVHPGLVLLDVADVDSGRADGPLATYLPVLTKTVAWARQYLGQPHPDLGRTGPVCPFVRPSMDNDSFYLAVWTGEPADVGEVEAVLTAYREWFEELTAEESATNQFKAILVLFPDIPVSRVPELIDGAQSNLKAGFVSGGLMVGEFHDGPPDKAGLWNPDFRPLRSPHPLLAIRHMVPTDLLFLEGEETFARQYFRTFGDRVPARLNRLATEVAARFDILFESGESMSFDTMLRTIHDWADRTPDAVALQDGSRAVSYRELSALVRSNAGRLRARGVGEDSVVGLLFGRSVDSVIAILSVWAAGGAYLPLDPRLPAARLRAMVTDAAPMLIVTDRTDLPDLGQQAVRLDELGPGENRAPTTGGRSLAYVIYTSGSTGTPKGVAVERASVANLVGYYTERIDLAATDRWLAVTTQSFDISVLEFVLPLLRGATVVVADSGSVADGQALAELIHRHEITVLQATPATWRLLHTAGGIPGRLRICISGGESLPVDLAHAMTAAGARLWNGYGPTEATVFATGGWVPDGCSSVGLGDPTAGTTVYLLDDDNNRVPPQGIGRLFIGGNCLARGYLNLPRLTAERFVPDPFSERPGARMYETGDLARYREDGSLEFLGRSDHQVKIRGFRIEPGDVESAIRSDRRVRDVVVVADERAEEPCLAAYVVLDGGHAGFAESLRGRLADILPEYMIPAFVVTLDRMPLTSSGKVDRQALPDPRSSTGTGGAPRDQVEEALVDLWRTGLKVDTLGVDDDLLAAGSHSLLAMRMWVKVKSYFQMDVPSSAALRARTVADLARVLAAAEPAVGHLAAVVRARRTIEAMTPEQVGEALSGSRR